MNVVRMDPVRCSPVIVSAGSIIGAGTPNVATPIAARSGATVLSASAVAAWIAANPRLTTTTASAVHSGERVVWSLMRLAVAVTDVPRRAVVDGVVRQVHVRLFQ